MKLLIDTQALIWFAENNPRLSMSARASIEEPSNDVFYSAASIWEMAIKHSLGKLPLRKPLDGSFRTLLEAHGFSFLPIAFDHATGVAKLSKDHGDPFDRLLIVQSQIEGMRPVSNDEAWDHYAVNRIW